MAALIGIKDDLLIRHLPVIGDIEEVTNLIKEHLGALFDRNIFTQDHHAMGLSAQRRSVVKFSHMFTLQLKVLKLPGFDDLGFDVERFLSVLGLDRILGFTFQELPVRFR